MAAGEAAGAGAVAGVAVAGILVTLGVKLVAFLPARLGSELAESR